MLVKSPKYRKPLHSNQIRLLNIIFKFRFVSVPLLAKYLSKDKSTIYEQLLTLSSQGYIRKNYDSSYQLPPRPASYALATKGIKFLRDNTDLSQTALRNMSKNGAASAALVERSLTTMSLCHQLTQQYPYKFDIYTKSEMSAVDELIRPLPDLMLRRRRNHPTKPEEYLLELLEPSVMSWLLRKRIRAHQELAEASEFQYPNVLLVATNDSTERRIMHILENCYDDFEFYATTIDRLATDDTAIWRQAFEDDEVDRPVFKNL